MKITVYEVPEKIIDLLQRFPVEQARQLSEEELERTQFEGLEARVDYVIVNYRSSVSMTTLEVHYLEGESAGQKLYRPVFEAAYLY